MADNGLKETTVTINGVEHTLQLSEEDAQRYKDREQNEGDGLNDASPDAGQDSADADTKAATPANKSRSTASK